MVESLSQLTSVEYQVDKLIRGDKETIHENANKDSKSFITQRDLLAGQVSKAKGLYSLPIDIAEAHTSGDIHFHDLNISPLTPMTNCCLLNVKDMLKDGFKMGNAEVEPPKSIGTAVAQIAQVILSVAGEQFGGISIDKIDVVLGEYAEMNYHKHLMDAEEWIEDKKKHKHYAQKKTQKDIYDALQGLEYEINTLCSTQGQTPFVTIGFGLGESWFEREIQKAILNVRKRGLGKEGRTAIFPKLIFVVKDGLNLKPSDVNYDIKQLAIECCSKRMYPDFVSYKMIEEITGSYKIPMGCRSWLHTWENEYGEVEIDGRMNLGVVTLNIVRISLESESITQFWNIFENKSLIVKRALEERIKSVCSAEPSNAPILYKQGGFGKKLKDDDKVSQLFLDKRASISFGYIGLYEVASKFYGSNWETNREAKKFTLDILKRMKELCDEWGEEWDIGCSVYSTPK